MADTGNGATLTRSGFVISPITIEPSEQTIGTNNRSVLGTTGEELLGPHDLSNPGTFTVTWFFNSEATQDFPAVDAGAAAGTTTTITWPVVTAVGATLVGTALLTSFTPPSLRNNEDQIASATFTWDGATGPTFTAGT